MNEKIRALAERARAWVNDPDNVAPVSAYIFYKDMYDKKFAELIVAECMQIIKVDMYEDAISNMWSKNKLQMIKQHFGVAE